MKFAHAVYGCTWQHVLPTHSGKELLVKAKKATASKLASSALSH